MRVPINWLNQYIKLPNNLDKLTYDLTMVGHMLDKKDEVNGNLVVDLELRGNRADCYSIIGIAREVSAIYNKPLTYPRLYSSAKIVKKLKGVNFFVKSNLVKRVILAQISDVIIEPSPKWLVSSLKQYGIESINNIVDLTNYVAIETGQPMHAFDRKEIGDHIEIRLAKKGEKMVTFQGVEISLDTDDLVWANKNEILSVAAAIGSKKHSISDKTENILLEAASYDQANVRRSIHKHNLFTDAGIRHEKHLDPNLVDQGVLRFLQLIQENNWGKIGEQISEYYPNQLLPWKISLNLDYVRSLSGMDISISDAASALKKLNFKIVRKSKSGLQVEVPTFRTDVTLPEDLVEEIIRIIGYDNIPTKTLSLEIPKEITPDYIKQERDLKDKLISAGFDEVISVPFIKDSDKKLNKHLDKQATKVVEIINRPSEDLEQLRISLLTNLLEHSQKIENERGKRSYLFEIGKIYYQNKSYEESRKLGIIYWEEGGQYEIFKGKLEAFFAKLNLETKVRPLNLDTNPLNQTFAFQDSKISFAVGGRIGDRYYLEIDLDTLLPLTSTPPVNLWPKYPPQIEDHTVQLPPKTLLGDVVSLIRKNRLVSGVKLIDQYKNYFTFRIWYQSDQKTLSKKEVEKQRVSIVNAISSKFGGVFKD